MNQGALSVGPRQEDRTVLFQHQGRLLVLWPWGPRGGLLHARTITFSAGCSHVFFRGTEDLLRLFKAATESLDTPIGCAVAPPHRKICRNLPIARVRQTADKSAAIFTLSSVFTSLCASADDSAAEWRPGSVASALLFLHRVLHTICARPWTQRSAFNTIQ